MATSNLKQFRVRNYLAKDFDSLRNQLVNYARLYYPDKIQDFSEASMGGLLVDMAAYVGDVMSFYLDHQYNELDPDTAIEPANIERLIRNAGVPITGASPSVATITLVIEVPAILEQSTAKYLPLNSALPIVKAGTIFSAINGVQFELLADVNFQSLNSDGTYRATQRVGKLNLSGNPSTFFMSLEGSCISGKQTTETFSIGGFVPFRKISLSQNNVTDILSVTDNNGNTYYRVNSLSEDVVYRNVVNLARDSEDVVSALKVVPAPYRFVVNVDLASRSTSIVLGAGDDSNFEDDAVPDPSDFAISLPYSKTFSRTSVNPLKLLNTRTLGVYSPNSQLSVTYRYGGGLSHNVPGNSINSISNLLIDFPSNPSLSIMSSVRSTLKVLNKSIATGGEDAPSIDELRALIPSVRNSQERIVTKEDLLARVYTLPANFGRVFRATVRPNENNPLASQLFVVSRTVDSRLVLSSDTLKENLKKYLNPYRLVTDSIDILDARIINLTIAFDVVVDPSLNKQIVLQNILNSLGDNLSVQNFYIDQPIVMSNLQSVIFSVNGVVSVVDMKIFNVTGVVNNRVYSDVTFNVDENTRKGMLYPPPGGIFEFKFPEVDIVGKAV